MAGTSMTMASLIEEAKQVYTAAGLDCGLALLPPVEASAIDALAEALALPVPPELWDLFRVHGGQGYLEPGVTGLFGAHRLLTPAEVLEHHRMFCDNCPLDPPPAFSPEPNDWGYWSPQLIPFASWDAYDLCIHSESGEVWEFIPNTGLIQHRPSIAYVLEEVIAEVRAGREAQLRAVRSVRTD